MTNIEKYNSKRKSKNAYYAQMDREDAREEDREHRRDMARHDLFIRENILAEDFLKLIIERDASNINEHIYLLGDFDRILDLNYKISEDVIVFINEYIKSEKEYRLSIFGYEGTPYFHVSKTGNYYKRGELPNSNNFDKKLNIFYINSEFELCER